MVNLIRFYGMRQTEAQSEPVPSGTKGSNYDQSDRDQRVARSYLGLMSLMRRRRKAAKNRNQ